ncbi:hypothetical protein NQ314_013228 [Rhamnusium bicolor]|uniref:Uncharacterized protein n=1 Tax=Rhamnusium bicolor TaxID=1586634 RepID=A0AAV8X6U2_9CUCU|nr:hypothetical protein NQ314_013228 [Rhamnusium bicolor]
MEKDSAHFCYDPYPTVSKQNTNSLKRENAIEGGSSYQHQILATTSLSTNLNNNNNKKYLNHSAELKAKTDEARVKTVENIWEITVSLNILYRDNWTRLAAQEITRFQDELLKSMAEEMALQQPLQVAKMGRKHVHENYEWSFAKAFLYSLTVLTTIGESSLIQFISFQNYKMQ